MNCKKFGHEMEENTKICSSGFDMESEQDSKSDSMISAEKNKNGLLVVISVAAALVLLFGIFLYMVSFGGYDRSRVSRLCNLGDRYLSELDYEQAVASYQAAIEIDPKCEDAYLGLTDIYIEREEYEAAVEILKAGLAQIDSGTISDRLEEVEELMAEMERLAEDESLVVFSGFVSWADAGLEDHVMDWQDEFLEARIRNITDIRDRDIMLSNVWEYMSIDLRFSGISNISALSGLTIYACIICAYA